MVRHLLASLLILSGTPALAQATWWVDDDN